MSASLSNVKNALGITGNFQDATIQIYFDEVIGFIEDAGVADKNITDALVARGVSDLWNYGAGEGKLSEYFMQRVSQLAYKG